MFKYLCRRIYEILGGAGMPSDLEFTGPCACVRACHTRDARALLGRLRGRAWPPSLKNTRVLHLECRGMMGRKAGTSRDPGIESRC
jgi:hypothetical protein